MSHTAVTKVAIDNDDFRERLGTQVLSVNETKAGAVVVLP